MPQTEKRLVVGFFGRNQKEATDAFQAVKDAKLGKAWILQPTAKNGSNGSPPELSRYQMTLREGEYLVATDANAGRVKDTIDRFREAGSPAIFALHTGPIRPPAPPISTSSGEGATLREQFAAIARLHVDDVEPASATMLGSLVLEAEDGLAQARYSLLETVRLGHPLTTTGEWILDNNYVFEVNIAEISAHLPKRYGKNLPGLKTLGGKPRIYLVAEQLAARSDYILSRELMIEALEGYQTVQPLNIAEIWVFPLALRLAIMRGIAIRASRASAAQQTREYVYLWTNRLVSAARAGAGHIENTLAELQKEPLASNDQFISGLAEQLHEEDEALAKFQEAMERFLTQPLSEIIRREHQLETTDRISVANGVGSLRRLAEIDFTKVFERVSLVDRILRDDPAGNFLRVDFATKDRCRRAIELMSTMSSMSEIQIAERALEMARQGEEGLERHVEYFLIGPGQERIERDVGCRLAFQTRVLRSIRRHPTFTYLFAIVTITICLSLLFAAAALGAGLERRIIVIVLALAAAFPLSELVIQIVNALIVSVLPPSTLPRMDFDGGIPAECATLVVIPMMLSSETVIARELEKLEVRYLGNAETHIHFALFGDFVDAGAQRLDSDEPLLQYARQGVKTLNERYGASKFFVFHREREWSESESAWIGKERKRGKVEELNAMLSGDASSVLVSAPLPEPIEFAIALDADTQLPAETGRRLIETIAHPLNRLRMQPDGRHRAGGYGIIQPRVSIGLPGATVTRFTRIFADARGTDPYCHAVSDVYQDLFGEAIFHGKAIFDVKAMHRILGNRFPEATLLSHDLIEGSHVGVGAATQIELFENIPTDYASFCIRQHRWIRGDWQIAPWIFGKVPAAAGGLETNPLPLANRWQILDNLRRSLVAPASMFILFWGWFLSASPGLWTVLIAVAVGIPALAPVVDRTARNLGGQTQGSRGLLEELQRAFVYFALLPHQAWIAIDAIGRVLYRRHFSRRNMLEWQTAEAADSSTSHLSQTLRQCLLIAAGSLLLLLYMVATGNTLSTGFFLLLWSVSPLVIVWLSRPVADPLREPMNETDRVFLRGIARRTWRTFDDLVGPQTNWLPPDNTQLALRVEVAQRTSPTNMGLWLTSALAAYDFGYITPDDLVARCASTVETLHKLERYEGHWLNWYDIQTLEPLRPRYVSTVDSGNLLACFWVMERGLRDSMEQSTPGDRCLRGFGDTLRVVEEVLGKDAASTLHLSNLTRLFLDGARGDEVVDRIRQALLPIRHIKRTLRWMTSNVDETYYWVGKLEEQSSEWLRFSERYLGWMETLRSAPDQLLRQIHPDLVNARERAMHSSPSLAALATGRHTALNEVIALGAAATETRQRAWLTQLKTEYQMAQQAARESVDRTQRLIDQLHELASTIQMGFLFDRHRMLFGIGYEIGGPVEFASHYDLLASECRLASLVSIAKGDVPIEHWHTLGRPYVSSKSGQVLLSWNGTMFEYLMPLLFMRPFENSFIEEACRQAVVLQEKFGEKRDVPWGISEAAHSALDSNQIYQYRGFGIPDLGLKPGLDDDLVVSPYSTLLALQVMPGDAAENLRRLSQMGLSGPMGFYESVDFTRDSTPEGNKGVIVYCYMAHHQGMSLVSLDNVLNREVMQKRFHANLRIRSVESLLFERVPVARSLLRHTNLESVPPPLAAVEEQHQRSLQEDGAVPNVQLLGNGRYVVALTTAGSGFSRWRDFDISRWRPDTTLDACGSFYYVRDLRSNTVWSSTLQPVGGSLGTSSSNFSASRVQFSRRVQGIDLITDICVAPEDDVEIRRMTLTNRGLRARSLEITSYIELTLASHNSDRAHQAFSKLFVQTEWLEASRTLIAKRRKRSPEDPELWAAHILGAPENAGEPQFETSREKFIGRNRDVSNPLALEGDLGGSTGTVIDPIFSLRCRVTLDARERIELRFLTLAAPSRDDLMALIGKYAG